MLFDLHTNTSGGWTCGAAHWRQRQKNKVHLKCQFLFWCCCWISSLWWFAVLFHNAIPFVGFGFLDNAIMIAAVSGFSYSVKNFDLTGIISLTDKSLCLFLPSCSCCVFGWTSLFVLVCSQGTQIELSIGVTLGISTMAGKNKHNMNISILLIIVFCFINRWLDTNTSIW